MPAKLTDAEKQKLIDKALAVIPSQRPAPRMGEVVHAVRLDYWDDWKRKERRKNEMDHPRA